MNVLHYYTAVNVRLSSSNPY